MSLRFFCSKRKPKSFDDVMWHILKFEGVLSHDPRDPGGVTKYGISKRAHPTVDIVNLTKKAAKRIYRVHYWEPSHAGELPPHLCLLHMDSAVQHGVHRAITLLQEVLGVYTDGIVGPKTLKAARNSDPDRIVPRYAAIRCKHYVNNKNFHHYWKGWLRRLFHMVYFSR